MDWSNFNSGLGGAIIGSLIGFFAAMYCQRWGLKHGVKTSLRKILLGMKTYEFATIEKGGTPTLKPADIFRESFPVVFSLYLGYRDLIACKSSLDSAWRKYKGVDKNTEDYLSQTMTPPNSETELEQRIDTLIEEIQ